MEHYEISNYEALKKFRVNADMIAEYLNELGFLPTSARSYSGGLIANIVAREKDDEEFQRRCGEAFKLHIQKMEEFLP